MDKHVLGYIPVINASTNTTNLYILFIFIKWITKEMEKKFLSVLNGQVCKIPPVWLMRQAGRYLPEYRATREKAGGFLDLCYNSDLSTEVTLQPIRRYDFDAAILFADILLIPHALGMDLWFESGEGPRLKGILDGFKITDLKHPTEVHEKLAPIYQTVRNLSVELPNKTALIGFAGAPWTVGTYMVFGKGSKDHIEVKRYINDNKKDFDKLIDILVQATIEYLSAQIESGAEVIKIFDSWAGSLSGTDINTYSFEPILAIAQALKKKHPQVPIIAFPRGVGGGYEIFSKMDHISCIALDQSVPPSWAKTLQNDIVIQGNLDPLLLVTGGAKLKNEVNHILENLMVKPFIFNLGHGITPDANPDNVTKLLSYIRDQ